MNGDEERKVDGWEWWVDENEWEDSENSCWEWRKRWDSDEDDESEWVDDWERGDNEKKKETKMKQTLIELRILL